MAERVIWERTIDHDKIRDRKGRFKKHFFVPAALILVLNLIFSNWTNTIGVLLVLGIVGLTWGTTVHYKSLSDTANPVMTINSGRLRLGNRDIIIEDIKRFTTLVTSVQTSLLGRYSRVHIGKALFRTDVAGSKGEPEIVEFGWPNMKEAELDGVRKALQRAIPDKWVEPTELVHVDELPKRRKLPGSTPR